MASVTLTELQLSEQCKDIHLHYTPDTTKDTSTGDEPHISNNEEQNYLGEETCTQEEKCDNNTNASESDRISVLSPSEGIEIDSSHNGRVEYDHNGESVTGLSHDIRTSAFVVATKEFISPKLDLKVPMRGIKTDKSRSKTFHKPETSTTRSFQLNADPECTSATHQEVVNNDNLETDAPEAVSAPPTPSSSVDAILPPALSPEPPMTDMVLLFAEDDEQKAHEFKEHLHKEIKMENLNIHLFSDIDCGQSELATLGTVHDRYHNILALITPNLKLDKYACFVHEILLTVGLKDGNGKEDRIIPVWTVADQTIITAFIVLKGINYYKFQTCNNEAVRRSYRKMVERIIMKGRNRQH